jgi:DNA-binding response OmpR family regulator
MKKILIADDDFDILNMLEIMLTAKQYDVVSTEDYDKVESLMLEEKPDLLILDVMFPENPTAGFEVCRKIKANAQIKDIPVIMLSAINETYNMAFSDKNAATQVMPAEKFLEKPVEPEVLFGVINELIG